MLTMNGTGPCWRELAAGVTVRWVVKC